MGQQPNKSSEKNSTPKEGEVALSSPSSPEATPNNETLSILERAEKLSKETKESEDRIVAHRKAIEELETRRVMGGETRAGSISKTPEELKKEESEKMASEIVGAFDRPE